MDNDNEIKKADDVEVKDLVEQSKLVFLREVIDDFRRKQALYDAGTEFAKTKKNRSPIVPLVVLGMTLLFVLGAVAVTLYIQEMSKKITVGIQEFEDVNLKDVLDAAKRNEQDMQQAKRELETLNRGMEVEIQTVRDETRRELELIGTERISQDEKNQKIRAANAREARRIDAIQANYNPKVQEKNKAIKAIQAKVDEYDSRQVEKARKQEEVLNNQQRLFKMELDKTTKYYEDRLAALNAKYDKDTTALKDYHKNYVTALEANHKKEIENLTLKYNPKITDPGVTGLLSAGTNPQLLKEEYPAKYRPLLEKEGITVADYQAFQRVTAEYDRVMVELKKIPSINSVPAVVAQLEYRHRVIAKRYDELWIKLSDSLAKKNDLLDSQRSEINQFLYALDSLQKTSRENGYLLDARDPKTIKVYAAKARLLSEGTIGVVFRRDDEYIGKIKFFKKGGEFFASLVELKKPDVPFEPFDKVLIQEQ